MHASEKLHGVIVGSLLKDRASINEAVAPHTYEKRFEYLRRPLLKDRTHEEVAQERRGNSFATPHCSPVLFHVCLKTLRRSLVLEGAVHGHGAMQAPGGLALRYDAGLPRVTCATSGGLVLEIFKERRFGEETGCAVGPRAPEPQPLIWH